MQCPMNIFQIMSRSASKDLVNFPQQLWSRFASNSGRRVLTVTLLEATCGFGPWSPCAAPFKEHFVYELKWTSRVLNVYGLRGLRLDLGAFFEVERMLMNH